MKWILGVSLSFAIGAGSAFACKDLPAVAAGESNKLEDYHGTPDGTGGYTFAPGNGTFCPVHDTSSCMALCSIPGACTTEKQRLACNTLNKPGVYRCLPKGTGSTDIGGTKQKE